MVGIKPGHGFTNLSAGVRWTPENGLQSANNDNLKGLLQTAPKPAGAAEVGPGWVLGGITSNDPRMNIGGMVADRIPIGAVGNANAIAQGAKFVADIGRALDGVRGEKVTINPVTGKKADYETTGLLAGSSSSAHLG
jgi:hypothetical protein